ncbi:MAG: hypothetical protein QOD75_338 [Blastocatellia bacterium]|jgi:hypothetical protein|nr:hypothetical protein [Blastocatellia bacterium]MEA2952923.1 hypothetical protein [Alphaproteobacteria bacterium]
MSDIKMAPPSRVTSFLRLTFLFSIIVTGIFILLVFSGVDFLGLSGFDVLFLSGPGPARFQSSYILARTATNALAALFMGFVLVGLLAGIAENENKKHLEHNKLDLDQSAVEQTEEVKENAAEEKAESPKPEAVQKERTFKNPRFQVVYDLEKVIYRLQGRVNAIYWTIIITLIAGTILIIFSGYLSSFDTAFSNLSSQVQNERASLFNDFSRANSLPGSSGALLEYYKTKLAATDKLYENLYEAMTKQISDRTENNKSGLNWSSTILRIGVIGLLVFLTQILVSLYRYNSRLIAFYRSRRDALLIADQKYSDVKQFAELLYPATLDFGKEPSHPIREMVDFIKSVGKTSKSFKESPKSNKNLKGE